MKRRRLALVILIAVALLFGGCDRTGRPGLDGAGAEIDAFAAKAKALDNLGPAIAAKDATDRSVSLGLTNQLGDLGSGARDVADRTEPVGRAGIPEVQRALASAATDVIRHLVAAVGGTDSEAGEVLSRAPGAVAFAIDVAPADVKQDRSRTALAQGHSRLVGDLSLEIEHFIYTVLLADPAARDKLAPRMSPADLPDPDPKLNLNAKTKDEWRQQVFDTQGRLFVPSPYDVTRWKAFKGWASAVNPTLADWAGRLADAATGRLFA